MRLRVCGPVHVCVCVGVRQHKTGGKGRLAELQQVRLCFSAVYCGKLDCCVCVRVSVCVCEIV